MDFLAAWHGEVILALAEFAILGLLKNVAEEGDIFLRAGGIVISGASDGGILVLILELLPQSQPALTLVLDDVLKAVKV